MPSGPSQLCAGCINVTAFMCTNSFATHVTGLLTTVAFESPDFPVDSPFQYVWRELGMLTRSQGFQNQLFTLVHHAEWPIHGADASISLQEQAPGETTLIHVINFNDIFDG